MSEEESTSNSDKEFEASAQKIQKAREEGNVPQSKELNTLALILGIVASAFLMFYYSGRRIFSGLSGFLMHPEDVANGVLGGDAPHFLHVWIKGFVLQFAPLFAIPMILIILVLIIQRSATLSMKRIKLDMKKISIVENFKKKYGKKGFFDFGKDTLKLSVIGLIAGVYLYDLAQKRVNFTGYEKQILFLEMFNQTIGLLFLMLLFAAFVTVIDVPFQWHNHREKLRMSREEMKKEMKQNEGDPTFKQKRKEKAREISQASMLRDAKDASVVVVNPEHYAVALKWDRSSDSVPICVAKGVDHLALKIREIAKENNIPIFSNPPCARSLHALVEVGDVIKPEHYAAVATAIHFAEQASLRRNPNG